MNKQKIKYAFYTMTHPSDGYYEIRHRDKGSVLLALIIVFLFGVSYSVNNMYAGFVVNVSHPLSGNSMAEIISVFALFFLFCVGNWSITCLMEGEGRFKDIVIATGYAMLPMVMVFIPATIISNFIAQNEEAFYFLIMGISIGWFIIQALVGIMTVHHYSLGKTLATLFLTFVAMLIIIFIISLLASLLGQVFAFFESIYNEILLRA